MKLDHVEAATVWVARRRIHQIDAKGVNLAFGRARGVLVGGRFIVTVAHGCARPGVAIPTGPCNVGDLWLLRRSMPLELGGIDTCMTVSRDMPIECTNPNLARLRADASPSDRALALAGPGEELAAPCFADPSTDVALIGVDRSRSARVAIRRTPIVEPEPVHVFGASGWVRAIATPRPGPLVEISDFESTAGLTAGACGGPIVDAKGEIVSVLSSGEGEHGWAGQLCMALPPWALARIWA